MIEDLAIDGFWWLPSNPEKQVPGKLTFTQAEGAVLALMGSFEGLKTGPIPFSLQREIVLGFSKTGQLITLLHCREVLRSINFPGMMATDIHASAILIGAHFDKPEDLVFKAIWVRFLYLDEWVGRSGFKIETQFEKKPFGVKIDYQRPDPIYLARIDDLIVTVHFESTLPFGALNELKITQKAVLKLENSKHPDTFQNWLNCISILRDFLTLATQAAVHPISIEAELPQPTDDQESLEHSAPSEEKKIKPPQQVQIFYSLPNEPQASKRSTHEMLFSLADILDSSEIHFRNWFRKYDLFKPVHDYFFSTIYRPQIYTENKFLNLIGAIEFYHRRTHPGKYQNDDEFRAAAYQELVKSIPSGLPNDFKASLKARMVYLNEYSLRKRLEELLRKHQEFVSVKIKDIDFFVGDVVNTRNFLIHQDQSLKDQAKVGIELFHLCEYLKFLLVVFLLSEIEIASDMVNRLLSRDRFFLLP